MPNKLVALCTLLVGAGLVAWLAGGGRDAAPDALMLSSETTYEAQSLDAMIQSAGGIVVGEIVDVSATRWNQDDGTFWEDVTVDARGRETSDSALPYYEITIAPRRTLVDAFDLAATGGPVVATVIGMSPVGGGSTRTAQGEAMIEGGAGQGPAVGQTMVAFVRRTEMAWRDGSRPIVQLMGDPGQSLAQGGADAFDVAATGDVLDLAGLEARVAAVRGAAEE